MTPLSNGYLTADQLREPERFLPLHAFVCDECFLVQLGEFESPERIFGEYAYFSSYSESWLEHARAFTDMIVERLALDGTSRVLELASNDGYLLQYFLRRGIPVLGIEPARNVARVAEQRGIPTLPRFFGRALACELADQGLRPDLVIGNNVLAHVPDLTDFVAGIALLLQPRAVATLEFPHLLRLMEGNQFDTIYHEHFSYFSLLTAERVFAAHGLEVFDVEELPTHGGSLRVYVSPAAAGRPVTGAVARLRARERAFGLARPGTYDAFAQRVQASKRALLQFLLAARDQGQRIVGYGAAAKGNTLLNYCGIREDILDYVVDRSPHKQGRYLPGTHVPIHAPERVFESKPDYLLIMPWNLRDEIVEQMAGIRAWGGRFVVPIPRVEVLA